MSKFNSRIAQHAFYVNNFEKLYKEVERGSYEVEYKKYH